MSLHPVEQALLARWPLEQWADTRSVLAVSGGCDSVALLLACVNAARQLAPEVLSRQRLHVAHFNHRWRAEADEDARFVQQLCHRWQLPFHQGEAPRPTRSEAAARRQRYAFLQQVAGRVGARFVATAHTADDQAETVLHNLLRGSNLAGLAGIPPLRALSPLVVLVRPLLGCWRSELRQYLQTQGQSYREDATNRLLRFRRNRLRHQVLPRLQRLYGPELPRRLVQLAGAARELYDYLSRQARSLLNRVQLDDEAPGTICLATAELEKEPALLVREMFVQLWREQQWPRGEMTRAHWHQLAQAARGPESALPASLKRFHLPGAILVCREGDRLFLRRSSPEAGR